VPRRLVLTLTALVWVAGFLILRLRGSWVPLAVLASVLAMSVAARDHQLRELLVPSPSRLLWGLLAAGAMIGTTYLLYPPAAQALPGFARATAGLYALLSAKQLPGAVAVLLICATATAEEVLFRGRLLEGAGAPWRNYALATAFYALLHLGSGSFTLVAIALVCGAFWGGLRVLSGSLVPSIVAHVLWDLSILVIHPLV